MRLSIQNKLFLGFGAVLALVACLAGFSFVNSQSSNDSFLQYRTNGRASVGFAEIALAITHARLAVMKFRTVDDPQTLVTVQEEMAKLNDYGQGLLDIGVTREQAEILDQIMADGRNYAAGFEEAIALQQQRHDEFSTHLSPTGIAIRQALTDVMESAYRDQDPDAAFFTGRAQQSLMLGRFYVQEYLLSNHEEAKQRAGQELAATRDQLQEVLRELQNPRRRALIQEAQAGLDAYEQSFARISSIIQARNAIYAEQLDVIGPRIDNAAVEAEHAQVSVQNDLGPVLTERFSRNMTVTAIVGAAIVLAGAVIAFFMSRSLSGAISSMTSAMRQLADDNLEVEVPGRERSDEIGDMGQAVQVFKDNMIEGRNLRASQAEEQADKERRQAVVLQAVEQFEAAATQSVARVTQSASQMQQSAQSLSALAEETSSKSTTVASSSEEATSNVQTVASAAEELSASIAEISRQVNESADMSRSAVEQAKDTGDQVNSLVQAAQKIGEVVSLIQDIAEQTNLLALNATIEAARAGEAGRGFAVVAAEVKELASQTSKATEEITSQISAIQSETRIAVGAVQSIGRTVEEMNAIAAAIAAAVEEQGAATGEIARNVEEASRGTQEVTENILGVSHAANETRTAAGDVTNAASAVNRDAAALKQEVENFLGGVRAA